MRRNCNLKLQLQPSPPQPFDLGTPHQQQQPLTIFYNGQVAVCDVTEFQARAIIMLASKEMMRRGPSAGGDRKDAGDREEDDSGNSQPSHYPPTPAPQSHMLSPSPSPTNAPSMKRSLQQFLQKRKRRILATSPYNVQ